MQAEYGNAGDKPADDYDELANETVNYKEEDLVELEGAGYMDPEYLDEEIGEITPEVKYTNISEMKIGSTISGSAGADEIFYYIKAARTQNIVLVLQENGNIRIRINEHDVNFIENEDGTRTYEMKVQSGNDYTIGFKSTFEGDVTLLGSTDLLKVENRNLRLLKGTVVQSYSVGDGMRGASPSMSPEAPGII